MRLDRTRRMCLALLFGLLIGPVAAVAQSLEGTGAVATGLLLRQMDGVKRVLMIGAHPDDEDTSFLTVMARRYGAETAYLALTRGDGGQNLIGPELWEGLGVIRTGELESARALDGGRQFFTRAFDYGFSKSAEEALTLWPREELLEDVVWVVRTFRPHVIVSVFSGTPRDGHGQHQAAGIMAREAFVAAADPTRFPEQLALGVEAWAPAKILQRSRRFGPGGVSGPTAGEMLIPTGDFDPLLGRSNLQLSMESRSQHRSQGMGAAQPPGPRSTGVLFVDGRVPGADRDVFSGVDTTLVALTAGLPTASQGAARRHLEAYRTSVSSARERFGLDPSTIVPDLTEALAHLREAAAVGGSEGNLEFRQALAHKELVATKALMAASGIVFDVRASDDIVVPGQAVEVMATLWNGSGSSLASPEVRLSPVAAWAVRPSGREGLSADGSVAPGTLATWLFEVTPPADAEVSRLYFLRQARDGARYRWPDDPGLWGLPRDPASVVGEVSFVPESGSVTLGSPVRRSAPWRYVGVDQARGEFVKPVLTLPALSVQVTPGGMAWPQRLSEARAVTVVVHSEADEGSRGELVLRAPAGWSVTPASYRFDLGSAGAERSLAFEVRPTGSVESGEHVFEAVARTDDGRSYDESYALIDYDHIERAAVFTAAEARVTVVPVLVREGLRVGYIMGTGDDGPEAIRQMGAEVQVLSEDQVRDGAFSGFDVIVLGVRAYEARPDVRAANEQLLDFARAGGTVVNQYNQYQFSAGGYGPDGLTIARPQERVSIETAPVRILEPNSPVFSTPNRITQSDFEGWVQERGLYFAGDWGGSYVPMLEMNDPGEAERHGSLLVAAVGDGVYVYAALSFFRQWDGRVPGAYRLFANLISLDAESWGAYAASR